MSHPKHPSAAVPAGGTPIRTRRLAPLVWAIPLGVVAFLVAFLLFLPGEPSATGTVTADTQRLVGRWVRPDGGYVLEVRSVGADGRMDAGYFNPRSINVARAEASRDGDTVKVSIELRDVNYPGSTYTLSYDPRRDVLRGSYFLAASNETIEVEFIREP